MVTEAVALERIRSDHTRSTRLHAPRAHLVEVVVACHVWTSVGPTDRMPESSFAGEDPRARLWVVDEQRLPAYLDQVRGNRITKGTARHVVLQEHVLSKHEDYIIIATTAE